MHNVEPVIRTWVSNDSQAPVMCCIQVSTSLPKWICCQGSNPTLASADMWGSWRVDKVSMLRSHPCGPQRHYIQWVIYMQGLAATLHIQQQISYNQNQYDHDQLHTNTSGSQWYQSNSIRQASHTEEDLNRSISLQAQCSTNGLQYR